MRAAQLKTLIILEALLLAGGSAHAGYVRSWVEAEGGCAKAFYSLRTDEISLRRDKSFLGRSGLEWTNDMLDEYEEIYVECGLELVGPANVPKGMMIPSDARKEEARRATLLLKNTMVEPARREETQRIAAERGRQQMAEEEAKSRIARAERLKAENEAGASEQARRNAERVEGLRREAELNDSIRTARLAQAREQAQRDRELADEITRQAEAEERNLIEARRIADEAAAKRKAAEARLAKVRAAAEAELTLRAAPESESRIAVPPAPSPTPPSSAEKTYATPSQTPSVKSGTRLDPTLSNPKPHGCEKPAVRQMLMDEFNRAAEKRNLPSAIDLTDPETEDFQVKGESFEAVCFYVIRLDNGKFQNFRLEVRTNSLGTPYVSYQPQGRPYR